MSVLFEMIVMVGVAREPMGTFATLEACRAHAHWHVSDPQPFNPQQHLFMSPSGSSKAYCRIKVPS